MAVFKKGDKVKFVNPDDNYGKNTSYTPPEILNRKKIYTVSRGNYYGGVVSEELITLEGFKTTWYAQSFQKVN